MTVGGLITPGRIFLDGGPGRATLDVLGAAFPTVTNTIELDGNSLIEFGGSGSITAIASGGEIDLDGPGTHIALRSNIAASGALAKLASNAGELILSDGAAVATTVGFVNNGSLDIDPGFSGTFNDGGSSLAIGGTLTNNNSLDIGNDGITAATNVSAKALVNTGFIQLTGSDNVQASMNINAAAPGLLAAGSYELFGDALLQFASGGIGAIGPGATLELDGAKSRVAVATTPNSNSALTGLASNAGTFELAEGATVSTTKGLTNTDLMEIDASENGGSTLTVAGVLSNSSSLDIGNGDILLATKVTAGGLVNTGTIDLTGGTNIPATLSIKAAAPNSVTNATYNLAGDALLQFASGGITSIGTGGRLSLDGALSRVASGSATSSNSALTKLASNTGTFNLGAGAALTTLVGFVNGGTLDVDAFTSGGSSLNIGGTLTNNAFENISIGNQNIVNGVTVTAKQLVNSGNIGLNGSSTGQATLNIKALAPTTLTGSFNLSTNALLEFSGGAITAIGPNANLSLSGNKAFVAVAGALTSNSALTKLASNAGTLTLQQGAILATEVGLTNTDALEIDENNFFSTGSGGSSLTIGGALTNNSSVTIGNSGLTASTTVATGALTNNATLTLTSGAAHAALKVGGGLTNASSFGLDDEFSSGTTGSGGSSLTVTGVLTNSGTLQLGSTQLNLTRATTATAAGLANTGTIDLFGGVAANGGSARASLIIGAVAPSVWTGTAQLSGNALLEFTGGSIQTIASGASLSLNGAQAFVADKAKPTSNGALAGLTTNFGTLNLDSSFSASGGSSLTLTGVLTNGGTLNVGNSSMTKAATVTAAGLVNTGTVNLTGGTARATLNIDAPAPGTLDGTYNLAGNALLEFAGGGVTTIDHGAALSLTGALALVALSSKLTSNSALAGLTTVAGTFDLEGGAKFSLTGGLTNTGSLDVDTTFGQGGSSLTIGGTLNTSNTFDIGNSELTAATKATLGALTNTGSIGVNGGNGTDTNKATLTLSGASSNGGFMAINTGGVLTLGGTLTVTDSLSLNGGTVSGGTLAGAGTIETGFDQTGTLNHVTIAAGATFTAQFGSTLGDNAVTVAGAMTGGNSATLSFLNHGTDNMTNVSGFPTIDLANGGNEQPHPDRCEFSQHRQRHHRHRWRFRQHRRCPYLSAGHAIWVSAGVGADVLTGGDGDDEFTAGGKTTMTGNAGANQFRFLAAGSNTITDFKASAANELVFSSSGFNLGLAGTSAPQQFTGAEASTLFTTNANGKFANTSQRLLYDTANHELFASADGSGGTSHLVASLSDHPASIAATQLFFIT